MRLRIIPVLCGGLCLGLLLAAPSPAQEETPAPPEGIEVQARGPVHEAFGEPTRVEPVPSPVVAKEPPQRIEESPPETRPEGDNVLWIPGYWAWDDDTEDYLWVSGFWRAVPPGRAWVPGAWQRVTAGWQWVSGYWAPADASGSSIEEVEYLPPPPESLDRGPSIPATQETATYVPGCWLWSTTRYVWRPGYWVPYRPGWVWVAASYRWTPAGYVFIPGYWDLPLLERGLLFAPVRFVRPIWRAPRFVYRPAYVVQPDFLCGALFVRNGYTGYYFGDYFPIRYQRRFVSWVNYRPVRSVVDINFDYYRNAYGGRGTWTRNLGALYQARHRGEIPRPPRTLVQQTNVINQITNNRTANVAVSKTVNITQMQNVTVLAPVTRVKNLQVTALAPLAGPTPAARPAVRHEFKMEKVTRERLVEEQKSITRFRALARERREVQTKLIAKTPKPDALKAPVRVKVDLPRDTPPARVIRTPKKAPPIPEPPPARAVKPTPPDKASKPPTPPVKPPVPPVKPVPPEKSTKPPTKPDKPMPPDKGPKPPAKPDRPLPPEKSTKPPTKPDKPFPPEKKPDRPLPPAKQPPAVKSEPKVVPPPVVPPRPAVKPDDRKPEKAPAVKVPPPAKPPAVPPAPKVVNPPPPKGPPTPPGKPAVPPGKEKKDDRKDKDRKEKDRK